MKRLLNSGHKMKAEYQKFVSKDSKKEFMEVTLKDESVMMPKMLGDYINQLEQRLSKADRLSSFREACRLNNK